MAENQKITELTEEQKAQIPQYVEEGLRIGRRTKPLDREKAVVIAEKLYKFCGYEKPEVLFFDSPKAIREYILANGGTEEEVSSYFSGNLNIGYFQYVDFFINNKIIEHENWEIYRDTRELHLFWTFEKSVLLCEFPTDININAQGMLHADEKPALAYKDGWGIYRLNGVAVPKEIVMTPSEKLDPKIILDEKNAEIRREIVRKVGIERLLSELGTEVLDKETFISWKDKEWWDTENRKEKREHPYELLRFTKFKVNGEYPVYLKMTNPSIGVYHVEEVHPSCKTVREAIHFRKPKKLQDIPVDDVNGTEYVQQGDVALWQEGAKSVRFFPTQLT